MWGNGAESYAGHVVVGKKRLGLGEKDYSILLNVVVIDFVFGVADYSFCAIMRKVTMKLQTVEFI